MSDDVDVVWVKATMNFGDVERGAVFALTPDRVVALGHYVEPVDLETFDPTEDLISTSIPLALGEPAVEFEEASDDEGGRVPAEDEPVRPDADEA